VCVCVCCAVIVRPHRSSTYVDAAYCYRPSSVVCRSVCHISEPCKNGCTDRDAVWVVGSNGPKESCVSWGSSGRVLDRLEQTAKVRSYRELYTHKNSKRCVVPAYRAVTKKAGTLTYDCFFQPTSTLHGYILTP